MLAMRSLVFIMNLMRTMPDFVYHPLWVLFDSNLFVGLVTILVGSSAYLLYRARNAAHKRDAANILLLEIQNAQRHLREAIEHLEKADNNELTMIAEDIILMPS